MAGIITIGKLVTKKVFEVGYVALIRRTRTCCNYGHKIYWAEFLVELGVGSTKPVLIQSRSEQGLGEQPEWQSLCTGAVENIYMFFGEMILQKQREFLLQPLLPVMYNMSKRLEFSFTLDSKLS